MTADQFARLVMERLDALGQITEEPGRLTRTFGSPATRRAQNLVAGWMRDAGMTTAEDAIGNLIGHYPATTAGAKSFLLGSHLDTVRDAGRFDGALGVIVALACVQRLHEAKMKLPFALDVIAFADEEGVRFQSGCIGSRVAAGLFDEAELERTDAGGVTLSEALLQFGGDPAALYGAHFDAEKILGYAEVHIEQGPVLEAKSLPVGIVTAIAGQTRLEVHFTGRAGHAGTTPMSQRRDALAAAAHFIVGVELLGRNTPGLVATVGEISVRPGASNVIPGQARLTLDVRHALDGARETATESLRALAGHLAAERNLEVAWRPVQSSRAVPCAPRLTALLKQAAAAHVSEVLELPSGAGHDAVALSAITPVSMLFVRCRGGLSHHPDESVEPGDVRVALAVMHDFLQLLAQ